MQTRKSVGKKKSSRLKVPILIDSAEAEVIRALRRQRQISRTEISNITGWSKAKASQEIRSMVEKGYLVEIGEGVSRGGRKPGLLKINHQLGYIVGIDIGATSIDVAIADVSGSIMKKAAEVADVRYAPEEVLGRCSALIIELAASLAINPDHILGIGVGVPGPVDFARGVLVAPPLMPDWENYSIRNFFKETFKSAYVVIDNDVNILALAEQKYGGATDVDHFLVVKIGTGIGCGIMIGRKIHRGSNGCAGDIGHISVDPDGPVCRCGNRGCLEAMTAGPAIIEKALQAAQSGKSKFLQIIAAEKGGLLTPEDVNAACRDGDEAALEIIRASGKMIGDVLAGLVNFFNPSHIFITGGISNFGNHLLIAIKRAVLRRSLPLATSSLVLKFSDTGLNGGVLGAIMLALDYLFIVADDMHYSF